MWSAFVKWRRRMGRSDVWFCHAITFALLIPLTLMGGKMLLLSTWGAHVETPAQIVVKNCEDAMPWCKPSRYAQYQFEVDGRTYKEKINAGTLRDGEKLPVTYLPFAPSVSRYDMDSYNARTIDALYMLFAMIVAAQIAVLFFTDRRRRRRVEEAVEEA